MDVKHGLLGYDTMRSHMWLPCFRGMYNLQDSYSHWPSSVFVSHILILTHLTPKMDVISSSETLVTTYKTT
jgi:hypothetical protein